MTDQKKEKPKFIPGMFLFFGVVVLVGINPATFELLGWEQEVNYWGGLVMSIILFGIGFRMRGVSLQDIVLAGDPAKEGDSKSEKASNLMTGIVYFAVLMFLSVLGIGVIELIYWNQEPPQLVNTIFTGVVATAGILCSIQILGIYDFGKLKSGTE